MGNRLAGFIIFRKGIVMEECNKPVGVFDSGVGGISVLRELVKQMPEEDYIYLGD